MDSHAIKGIAQTYFDAWRSRDVDRLRSILADDVSFRGPLGTTDGADATIAGPRGMAENVMRDIDISLMAVDGSDVLTWYDLHTAATEPLRRRTRDDGALGPRVDHEILLMPAVHPRAYDDLVLH